MMNPAANAVKRLVGVNAHSRTVWRGQAAHAQNPLLLFVQRLQAGSALEQLRIVQKLGELMAIVRIVLGDVIIRAGRRDQLRGHVSAVLRLHLN